MLRAEGAAEKLGLLVSDEHHKATLNEASTWATGFQLRELFSIILVYGSPSSPKSLFLEFSEDLLEDLSYKWRQKLEQAPDQTLIINFTLHLIEALVVEMSKMLDSVGL